MFARMSRYGPVAGGTTRQPVSRFAVPVDTLAMEDSSSLTVASTRPEAGLITSQRRGTWIYFRVVPAALASPAGLLTPDLAAIGAS